MFWTIFVERTVVLNVKEKKKSGCVQPIHFSARSSVLEIIKDYGPHADITELSVQLASTSWCVHQHCPVSPPPALLPCRRKREQKRTKLR